MDGGAKTSCSNVFLFQGNYTAAAGCAVIAVFSLLEAFSALKLSGYIKLTTPKGELNISVKANWKNESGGNTEIILPSSPHRNGTQGHWETILDEVEVMKQSGEYKKIYVNKGLHNEVPDTPLNNRPDIMGVRHNGIIDQVEVPSKTDTYKDLMDRMKLNQSMLGDRAGPIKVRTIGKR